MKKFLTVLMMLFATSAFAQTRTFTVEFNHDGINTSSYEISVDGTRSLMTVTCSGTGDTRLCTSPLVLTLNTNHSVSVFAIGDFGEASSLPFVCAVPKAPVNPKVRK